MPFDGAFLTVDGNAREVSYMLIGTCQLIEECSLATVLVTCQSKGECSFLHGTVCCVWVQRVFFVVTSLFSQTWVLGLVAYLAAVFAYGMLILLVFQGFFHAFLRNAYLRCICQCEYQFVVVYAHLHSMRMAAPGIMPMSRKCCLVPPCPPTVVITACCPVFSSRNVILYLCYFCITKLQRFRL